MIDKSQLTVLLFDYQSSVLEAGQYFHGFKHAGIIRFHQPLLEGCPPTELYEYRRNKLTRRRNLGRTGHLLVLLATRLSPLFYLLVDLAVAVKGFLTAVASAGIKYDFCIGRHITTALTAAILRKAGIVRHSIVYVTDYYATEDPKATSVRKLINVLHRRCLTWTIKNSDVVWTISPAMLGAPYLKNIIQETDKPAYAFETAGCDRLEPAFLSELKSGRDPAWKKRIAFLGNVGPHHGLDMMLEVLPEIIDVIPDVNLRVIGTGPEEKNMRSAVRAKGLDSNVTFYGYVEDRREVYRILSGCAIGLATYKPASEFDVNRYLDPGKIRMYMAVGLPVIISRGPYFTEVIKRYSAGFVVDYDAAQVQKALLEFLRNDDMMAHYRQNMLKVADEYAYDVVMDKAMKYTVESLNLAGS